MSSSIAFIISMTARIFIIIVVILEARQGSLNIKSKTVGDGQYGTSRQATQKEIDRDYLVIPFEPEKWRMGMNLPTALEYCAVLGYLGTQKHTRARIDTSDSNTISQAMGHAVNTKIAFEKAAKDWLEITKSNTVAKNTYEYTYRNSVNNHLIPYFGNYAVANIRKNDIQKFFNERKYMSNSLLHKLDITLYAIFENAIENDIIYKNPCKNAIIPQSEKTEKEMHSYSAVEARMITDYAKTVPEGNSIIIMLKTGIRRGELLGLRWKDIDIKNKIIHVRQSVKETRGALEVGTPKTKMSARDIPIDDELIQVLNNIPKEVIRYKGKRKKRTAYTVKNEYVIADMKDGAMYPSHWQQRVYAPFMENLVEKHPQVPALNAHELRHTYGTLLYKSGTDIYTIQKLMGHASIEITTRIYVHNDIDTIKKAMKQDW